MGSKGSNTSATNQTQTYTPNPQAAGYINSALDRAGQTANLPFSVPQAPVAGFSNDQQSAFNTVNNAQGMAQPYINQAANYFGQSAAGPNVSQFFNPYAGAVMGNLSDIFGQQQSQTTGQLTQAAGGVGADRIAVGQANLAKQQGLAAGQTLASLYQPAMSAALQEQNVLQGAGYGTAALGSQAQNAALSGAQAQLGTGGLQQQLSQAQMNSPYQRAVAQAAFPYQQSQFYTGAVGALAPGLGGTTSGYGNTTATPAPPSIFSQLLGAGTAAAGIYGGLRGFGGNGGSAYQNSTGNYNGMTNEQQDALQDSGFDLPSARGGRIDPYAQGGAAGYAEGGEAEPFGAPDHPIDIAPQSVIPQTQVKPIAPHMPTLNLNPPQQQSGSSGGGAGDLLKTGLDVAKIAMMFAKRGGRINANPYAEGGDVPMPRSDPREGSADVRASYGDLRSTPPVTVMEDLIGRYSQSKGQDNAVRDAIRKKAVDTIRRHPEVSDPTAAYRAGRYAGGGATDTDVINPDEPYRLAGPEAMQAWRDSTPINPMAFAGNDPEPPAAAAIAARARPARAAKPAPATEAANEVNPYSPPAAAAAEADAEDAPRGNSVSDFAKSPWAALTAAGLGMMAGTSPFAGVNIGQGGLQGVKTLEAQRAASQKDTTIEQAAKRLEQEAKFHEDTYTRMTPAQKAQIEQQKLPYEQMTAAQKATHQMNEREQAFKEMQPVKVGTDPIRGDIYARKDPATGEYIDIMTGKKVEVPPAFQAPPNYNVPGAQSDTDPAALPPHARYTQGVTVPEGVVPEALAQLPAQVANKIRAVDEGRISLTSIPLRERGQFMNWLTTYDPNFDQSTWTLRNQQQRDLSSNGNAGKMILAVNQLLPHLKTASDKAQALENSAYPAENTIANWWLTATGDPRVGNFETVREVAAMDAARLLRGSGQMAEQDIEFWRKNLASAGSPRQLQDKIKLLADDLMGARISSIEHAYRTNMRMEPPDFISKEAKEALASIKRVKITGGETVGAPAAAPAAAAAAAPAPAAAAPAVGTRKPFKQGIGVWNGTAWVPE